jgi:hypothetical protein
VPLSNFFLIKWLQPQRDQSCISLAAPAPSKADEAVNWLQVDAIAVWQINGYGSAKRLLASGTLPSRPAPSVKLVPFVL